MPRTPVTQSDHPPLKRRPRIAAWLRELWQAVRPGLLLAGVLLVAGGTFAIVVTAGALEQHRRMLASPEPGEGLGAKAAVVGLALEVERVPPGLAAGGQVAVLDTGGGVGCRWWVGPG